MKNLLLLAFVLFSITAHASCESVLKSVDSAGNSISEFQDEDNPQENAALILPPTGGENIADKFLAISLCQRGLNSVILNYRQDAADPADLSTHDRITKEILTWVDDFLAQRNQKFVIIGSSLGSLYASIAFSESQIEGQNEYPHLQKIVGAVLTVAGGSLAEILATSQLPSVAHQQQLRINGFALSNLTEYQRALENAIKVDPLRLANPNLSKRLLMFSSTNDKIVPTKTQDQLWEAWGRPERHRYFTDHMWTIAAVYFTQPQKIFDFSEGLFSPR